MYNFFVDKTQFNGEAYVITGGDYNHIKNVLRMQVGERFLVSSNGLSSLCELSSFSGDSVIATVVEKDYLSTNLPIDLYLLQGMPKSDKLELIIQKAVELGANAIVPVDTARAIVKIEEKKKEQKRERWQAISESAAKQSKRNVVPTVYAPLSFKNALKMAEDFDVFIVPYECAEGMAATKEALSLIKPNSKVGVLIGPEGGFTEEEIELATKCGGKIISLGKRILRAETAAITALSMVMLYTELNFN